MVWQQDVSGAVVFTNAAWFAITQIPRGPSAYTVEAWRDVVHPDDFDHLLATIAQSAERRLRELATQRERDFRALGDAMPVTVWTAEPDSALDWYNRRWYEYTGQTPEEASGCDWQAVHRPDDFLEVMRRWRASIASGEPFEMEFRLREHKKGHQHGRQRRRLYAATTICVCNGLAEYHV